MQCQSRAKRALLTSVAGCNSVNRQQKHVQGSWRMALLQDRHKLTDLIIVCEAASALIMAMIRADSRHSLSGACSPVRMGCVGNDTTSEPGWSCAISRCRSPSMPVDCSQRCLVSSCEMSAHSVCRNQIPYHFCCMIPTKQSVLVL